MFRRELSRNAFFQALGEWRFGSWDRNTYLPGKGKARRPFGKFFRVRPKPFYDERRGRPDNTFEVLLSRAHPYQLLKN